jgi:hypothetical protein
MAERDQGKAQAKSKRATTPAAKVAAPAALASPKAATAKPPGKAALSPQAGPMVSKAPAAGETAAAAVKRLEAETAMLTKALAAAEARITELERQRDSALDRIEWVIDSLHSLREEQG